MINFKKAFYCLTLISLIILIFSGANYSTPKLSPNDIKLKKQISLLQGQLKEKTNIIKKLRKDNEDSKKKILEIAIEKSMIEASQSKSVPEDYFSGFQVSIKQMIIDGTEFILDPIKNNFVCGYDSQNNVYIPVSVVGEILNKPFEWDSQNKILYFGDKSAEEGNNKRK